MDGPRDYHTKCGMPKTNVQSKKKDTNELISKMEIDSPTQKTNLWLPKEKERSRRIGEEVGIILLYIKQITNKDLLYTLGNYTQHFVITCKGKEAEKNICKTESLCCTPERNTIV